MEKNSNMVQTVMLVIFGVGILFAVLIFAGKVPLPGGSNTQTGPTGDVVIWGVLPYGQVASLFNPIEQANKGLKLQYEEKKPETIQADLVDALSAGKGPDIFMMGPGQVAKNIDRLYMIPFTSTPDTTFKNTFADIGTDFLTDKGILAIPMFMDPMVMYYNKDIFASNFTVNPPTTWDELVNTGILLTQKNDAAAINQSGVALGTSNNISYPKDLVALRVLQKGNPIIKFNLGKWESQVLNDNTLSTVMAWYTDFANPKSDHYTWNPSLPNDRDMFIAGKLGIYFGYPTELETIRKKNPNLNFAVAMIPQEANAPRKVDYARVYTLGISKISKNLSGAVAVAGILTNKDNLSSLLSGTYYAPARRDMLADKPRDNAELALVYNSAIIAKEFFDPDAAETKRLITTAIDQVNSGNKIPDVAVQPIGSGLRDLVSKLIPPALPTAQ